MKHYNDLYQHYHSFLIREINLEEDLNKLKKMKKDLELILAPFPLSEEPFFYGIVDYSYIQKAYKRLEYIKEKMRLLKDKI